MPTTVGQILRLPVLEDARILAGRGGLDRAVTSVTVGEVPDIADWLSGGEMVLSTMFAFRGDIERQREFCKRVMMADAAALFVKTTRFVGGMPSDSIELADKRNFPIIEVPQGLRWTKLMQDVTEVIINRQASLLEQSQAIHRSLLGVVIRGGGWQELADECARLLSEPMVLLDTSLEVLATSTGFPVSTAYLDSRLTLPDARERFAGLTGPTPLRVQQEGLPALFALPIVSSHRVLGYVCTLSDAKTLSAMQILTLEHAATIAALEMAQDRVRFETEVRLKGDFVDDVISGAEQAEDSLLRRGVFLGCDLRYGATVVLLGIDEYDGLVSRRGGFDQEDLDRQVELFFTQCSRLIGSAEPSSLVSLKSGRIVVFVCGKSAEDQAAVKKLATALQALGQTSGGLSVSAGIGAFTRNTTEMDRGYQQALVALKVGRKLTGAGSLLSFENVGTYRILLDTFERDPDEIRALYDETIGPIDAYDTSNGTQLTQTLAIYFRNNENLTQTATDLHAHRHTIRYRLEKIAEINGLNVFETEHKERLGLGLKAKSLLAG
jgi:PucR family transcriptional regulator, purine catabolism regulatory protein